MALGIAKSSSSDSISETATEKVCLNEVVPVLGEYPTNASSCLALSVVYKSVDMIGGRKMRHRDVRGRG